MRRRSSPGATQSLLIAVTIAWAIGGAILLSSTFFYRVLRERGLIAIERLMGLQAKSARVERTGDFVDVALGADRVDDVIQVRPGDKVPVDGTVLRGSSYIVVSMISGVPVPVA